MNATRPCLAMAALASCLAACAPDLGDLGRPRQTVWNTAVLPAVGSLAARARGETVSSFHLTDDENELRDRAWRFIMPAHERSWFDRETQELARTRIIPVSWQSIDQTRYHAALVGGTFRSEHSRYERLAEDAIADANLVQPFRKMADRVVAADRVRLRTAALSPAVGPGAAINADHRVAENDGLIAWVRERLRYRLASYRHALDNLVVEMPSRQAVMAERAILLLEAELGRLDGLTRERYQLAPLPSGPAPASPEPPPAVFKD